MVTDRRSLRARFAAAGLDPDVAQREFETAGFFVGEDPDPTLLKLLSEAADPAQALRCLSDMVNLQPATFALLRTDDAWLSRVVAVSGASRPLGELLSRFPDAVEAVHTLEPLDPLHTVKAVTDVIVATDNIDEQAAGIAAIRRRATADIAARDLTGVATLEAVTGELSALAQSVLSGVLAGICQGLGRDPLARIAVIGMGKLGGYELNYVSDVDVLFVHEPCHGVEDEAAAKEANAILSQMLDLLNRSTTMGRAYEIDPTLRPEGRSGALSRRLDAFVNYWERWAKTWEFQSLLKARPVAGDEQLGQAFLDAAEPFIWPEVLNPEVVAEIRAMKNRIETKPEVLRDKDRQVKLGPGGIRDIEFSVQLLQLVHGRGDRSLRLTGTLDTLQALVRNGYVDEDDAAQFADSYRLLRTIEHRLQLVHERRTHTIPEDPKRQELIARSLGYRAAGDTAAREPFVKELKTVQAQVRALHAKLFYRPLLEMHAVVPAAAAGVSVPGEVTLIGEEQAVERLVALGFTNGRAALKDVRQLTSGVSRSAVTVRAVLPAVLQVLQDTPDPDSGLALFRELLQAHGDNTEWVRYLRDHPAAADLLGRVLGTSKVAGELLIGQPQGVDWLKDERLLELAMTRDVLARKAVARLHWQDTTDALRRFKRLELLRIVLRDLGASGTVADELTALGDACLVGALRAELRRQAAAYQVSELDDLPVRIAIIGMGKYGGHELQYASDLDVLFVHDVMPGADETIANKMALDVAANVIRSLSAITAEGTAFAIDADLRPEGKNGPLSRSLASYQAYWERWADPWEFQALVKARYITGDRDLADAFLTAACANAYPTDGRDVASPMRKMKLRLEKERIPRRVDPEHHVKLGPGGMADVEWTVQLLQQQHGATLSALRTPGTLDAIDSLQDAEILTDRDATWLRDGYRFLAELRNRMYLLRFRDVDVFPTALAQRELLGRALGYGRNGWRELEEERLRHARHVRRVCEQQFYGVENAPVNT